MRFHLISIWVVKIEKPDNSKYRRGCGTIRSHIWRWNYELLKSTLVNSSELSCSIESWLSLWPSISTPTYIHKRNSYTRVPVGFTWIFLAALLQQQKPATVCMLIISTLAVWVWVPQKQRRGQGLGCRLFIWEVISGSGSEGLKDEAGEEEKQTRGMWFCGLTPLRSIQNAFQNCPSEGWEPGAFITWLMSPISWGLTPLVAEKSLKQKSEKPKA